MNSQLIRERLNAETTPFHFRLSDGTRVHVAHPDFVAVSPGLIIVIDAKTQAVTKIDPLHVVALEEAPAAKSRGRRSAH